MMGFLIVGTEASAGGLEALGFFPAHTPPEPGMALVFLRSPKHKSPMAEILQKSTPIMQKRTLILKFPNRPMNFKEFLKAVRRGALRGMGTEFPINLPATKM